MATIEDIVGSIDRELAASFEERLRAVLADRDRDWLVEQVVRLALGARGLTTVDANGVRQARQMAREARQARVRGLSLDRAAVQAFVGELADVRRDTLEALGHLLPEAPAKGTRLLSLAHRGPAGEALLERAKDMLYALLFGDETTDTRLERIQHELLTLALPRHKAQALDFMRASTELEAAGTWQDPEAISSDERAANVLIEVQFGEIEGELVGSAVVTALRLINDLEINEQVLYARMIDIEQTTLIV